MRALETILARYGRPVELRQKAAEPGIVTAAFLQAMAGGEERERVPTRLGTLREETFLYLGDPNCPLEELEAGGILCDGILYEVLHARLVWMGNQPSHWRAILKVKEGLECSS